MTDIVKRLVGLANSLGGDDEDAIMAGVAEIERLTTALAKQTEQHEYPCSPHCAGYLREQAAQAEIARLRADELRTLSALAKATSEIERLRDLVPLDQREPKP